MYVGLSIFLITLGAILRFAVADQVDGVNLPMVGLILMAAGGIALILSLLQMLVWRDRAVTRERVAPPR